MTNTSYFPFGVVETHINKIQAETGEILLILKK